MVRLFARHPPLIGDSAAMIELLLQTEDSCVGKFFGT
jgi:hypothetical protein